jgi:hypothetical protein
MFNSDRGEPASIRDPLLLIGIVAALALAWYVGVLGGRNAERRQNYSERYAATAKQDAATACRHADPSAVSNASTFT